jgi:transcriptional regulator with XRE-family HTH domain
MAAMEPTSAQEYIAGEVRAEMARQRRTQGELGEVLRITQPAVTRKLLAQRIIRAEELQLIAEWLGVPVTQFLPRRREPVAS